MSNALDSMSADAAPSDAPVADVNDLGPLAWVLDELRKSLEGATQAIRRFVRDADLARGADLAALETSQLRIARQQLHQAVGALEMVGQEAPAKLLRAMEALAQKFVQRPELCSEDAAAKVERASFALMEFLEAVLRGKPVSAVALFPQYRDVLQLVGEERVHPADLWTPSWRWLAVDLPPTSAPIAYAPAVRAQMDPAVLSLVKTGHPASARGLRDICLGLAAGASALAPRTFWAIAAGCFEAVAQTLCPVDVYLKRVASRVLLQYATLARGDQTVSERLAQDLLFYCAQSVPGNPDKAPVLTAVRQAYGLAQARAVDYDTVVFGRFDPAWLVQARKRIAAATETWSALSGGDTARLKVVAEQFSLVGDSMLKLHPQSDVLARALMRAVESTVRAGEPPRAAVAMEVATAILYLSALYDDLDPADTSMPQRSQGLAQRLDHVLGGGQPEPLEGWMEELYRRVSDRQTMGGVVDELRTTLAEVENALDAFFRKPQDPQPLVEVPNRLGQMRGVFSVLGLDQAALACLRLRDRVEPLLLDALDETTAPALFETLGNSLGALGFLIDMLNYQRTLAQQMFVYDEARGEFTSLMGRTKPHSLAEPMSVDAVAGQVAPEATEQLREVSAWVAQPLQPSESAAAKPEDEDEDTDLREIFLHEAREVLGHGRDAVRLLADEPADLGQQTTVRRVFHTLKGSSRMVALAEFGEAAWAMEQLLNSWLAEQKPASADLLQLSQEALQGLTRWVEDIAQQQDADWRAQPFRQAADALRLQGLRLALDLPGDVAVPPPESEPASADLVPELDWPPATEFDLALDADTAAPAVTAGEPPLELAGIDFGSLAALSQPDERTPAAATEPSAPEETPAWDELDTQPGPLIGMATVAPEVDARAGAVPEVARHAQEAAATGEGEGEGEGEVPALAQVPPEGGLPAQPVAEPGLSLVADADTDDEQVKVIGSLRIGIPLYNVYLNEADEWSRRLQMALSEWALELHQPLAESTVGLAHALAGSSATVGFQALSELARALEQALQHVSLQPRGQAEQAEIFMAAADDIRHLLHQFAAGFLKEPKPQLLQALRRLQASDFAPTQADALTALPDVPDVPTPLPSVASVPDAVADAAEVAPVPQTARTAATTPTAPDERDDDLDAVDAIDPDLLPIFEEEAAELLPQLSAALREWLAQPAHTAARMEVLRVLHTLKGSARLAGAMRLGEMAHRMESVIEQMGQEGVQATQIEPLLARFDALQQAWDALQADSTQAREAPLTSAPQGALPATSPAVLPAAAPTARSAGQSVRVRAQLLDRLLNQAGEVMITRSRLDARVGQLRSSLGELTGNLDRLRQHLREMELQAESQMQSRLAQTKDSAQAFDPLEFDRFTRVQELTRMMAESVNDVATVQRNLLRTVEGTEDDAVAQARQARELQRDLLRTRMVEFESIAERLYSVVRQAAKETGKQVKLDITGGSLEMDRSVLERMAPAFEHMLRNAVVHGMESAAQREAAAKPAVGTIAISLHQEGNDVSVVFSDDGAGLDLARIRQKAQALGRVSAGAALSDDAAAELIFEPGFSTAAQVTELAGRGIGMDVVRAEVYALGGRIETATRAGLGTDFKLVLPLTTAVTQVVMLRMGRLTVGVPANLIEVVRRISGPELAQVYAQGHFDYADEAVPFFWAGALLQSSGRSQDMQGKSMPVVVCRSAGQRLAIHVDEVLGNQEVVVKNLGPQLSRLPGLAGMSVLASGAVVLIYNPVALGVVYGERARALQQAAASESHTAQRSEGVGAWASAALSASTLPLVLVVDDSITVRRVTQRLLKREGYRVAVAADGLQALERLQEERPAVLLTDIEMPRMDGFDLVRTLRMDARWKDLPIIMITSRMAQKHREHARELGVDHYLGKPYSEDELIHLVRQYSALAAQD